MRRLILLLALACTPAADNAWLGVCSPEMSGFLTLDPECPEIAPWPSTPITVYSEDFGGVLDDVIDRWEHRRPLHRQDLFERTDDPFEADVIVFREVGSEPLGSTRFLRYDVGRRLRAEVRIFNTSSRAQEECVIFHELGHVLGLAHDDYGPMQPAGCGEPCDPSDTTCMEGVSLTDVRVTDGDHRRLQERY